MPKILLQTCGAEIEVKKSRFLSRLIFVENVCEVKKIVQDERAAHPRAKHICYAYALLNGQSGSNDDGEPHGTAGRPLLEILIHSNLVNVCVVVIRYFGGTLLGKGGLARAYKDAAKEALATAKTQDFVQTENREYDLSYSQFEIIKKILEAKGISYHCKFTDEVRIRFQAEQSVCCEIEEKIERL